MNLEIIMTTEEQEAVKRLIEAHLIEQNARLHLLDCEQQLGRAARELTKLHFRLEDEAEGYVSTIPANFVTYYAGEAYLINVDEEGDNGHEIKLIAGVLGSPPNGN